LSTIRPVQTPRTRATWQEAARHIDVPDRDIHAAPAGYTVAKRIFDVTAAILGLILVAPLMGAIAAAIKLGSPGPVIFRQRRPGFRGRPFEVLKFRTMVCDAEARLGEVLHLNKERDHSLIRIPDDPRTTRIGRLLRKTSLDELPQLVNVMRGEMSLVGPRPISRPIYDPRAALRVLAMPGLTGLWQVSGRKDTSCDFMLQKDMEYLANRSLWLDFRILVQTITVVFRRSGAR
jgi:lipopolysaccharide/colanic/teichoic acid biosynthesis glycosyltransferase